MEDNVIHIDIEKRMMTVNGAMNLTIRTIINPGDLIALYGPSGAGKTTLLKILSGLLDPDKGSIKFGSTIWYDSDSNINVPVQKRNISFMFQDYALFPNMTVEQNILYAQPEKNNKTVNELLHTFGLIEFKKHKPDGLSGGQKQRVALARALARKPQLLLLDEPLSALDPDMRTTLQNEISRVHQMLGVTTILVSHDLNEVFRLASNVLCIDKGLIQCYGKPEEVFTDNNMSGKVQITGQIARIDKQDTVTLVTVISGNNQIIKVIAFENDIQNLLVGDRVMVFTKAFNPMISKIK